MMQFLARDLLQSRLPDSLYRGLVELSHLRPAHRRWAAQQRQLQERRAELDRLVLNEVQSSNVLGGPFEGMAVRQKSSWGVDFSARLIGTYECELHPSLEALIDLRPRRVIDVGCADGYYAVGLALRLPDAIVDAYDVNPAAIASTIALAKENGVAGQMNTHRRCTSDDLMNLPASCLVIMDCEGAEMELITKNVAATSKAKFIIECHDSIDPDTSDQLRTRFSHRDCEFLLQQPRSADAAPFLDKRVAIDAMNEFREPQDRWLVVS